MDQATIDTRSPARRFGIGLLPLILFGSALLAVATPASAHTCTSDNHEGCNGHQCPDDGQAHSHYTEHSPGGDHECTSTPNPSGGGGGGGGGLKDGALMLRAVGTTSAEVSFAPLGLGLLAGGLGRTRPGEPSEAP